MRREGAQREEGDEEVEGWEMRRGCRGREVRRGM